MFNLFYVESPLQLLSAIDAKKELTFNSVLIVRLGISKRKINNDQMLALINKREWRAIHYIKDSNIGSLGALKYVMATLFLYLKYKNKVNKYFFGEFRNLHIVALERAIKPNDLILLDDGAFTIVAQLFYIKNGIPPYKSNAIESRIYKFLLGVDLTALKVPHLHSFFNFNGLLLKGQRNYYKEQPRKEIQVKQNEVCFFGSKFSEASILTEKSELAILQEALKLQPNKKFYYVPHRYESFDKLKKVELLGVELLNLNCPAESYFDDAKVMPETVISCYSTVLYSCFSRFSNVNTVALDIRPYLLKTDIQQNVDAVYKYYESLGITVVPITIAK